MTNRLIIEQILKKEQVQLNTEEIFQEALKQNNSLQIETVYVIMKKLTKRGLVMKIRSNKAYYTWVNFKCLVTN